MMRMLSWPWHRNRDCRAGVGRHSSVRIPEILAGQRLGHDVPGMRGLYADASPQMREELLAALQARWEESLRQRAGIHPHSTVPLPDSLLAPFCADRAIVDGTS